MVTGIDVRRLAIPLAGDASLDPLLRHISQARVVQLGEASHGTHEYYRWRAALTRRLVEECGFSFVAVEGDWPDCERVDAAVRGAAGAPQDPREALDAFERWPTWMWANTEVVDFCRWLRGFNAGLDEHRRVGFHGLDVYSLWESMRAILVYLREYRPGDEEAALAAYRCFEPYAEDPQEYALALRFVPEGCQTEVVRLLARLRERAVRDGAAEFAGLYDVFCWFDETSALHPLHLERPATDELETYPTGV